MPHILKHETIASSKDADISAKNVNKEEIAEKFLDSGVGIYLKNMLSTLKNDIVDPTSNEGKKIFEKKQKDILNDIFVNEKEIQKD